MEKNLKIEKLSDIVAWADGIIRDCGYYEEKYRSDATTAYCNVKAYELWRIRDAALKGMERHSVYTDALNKDIADKAAKIDLLEKEIEGRKEGYHALKERMDHISALEEGWYANAQELVETCKSKNEEIEKLKKELEKICKTKELDLRILNERDSEIENLKKELADCKVKIRHQKENLDGINKTLEIRTKENESLIKVKNNQEREIEAHESENARLSEKILELKKERDKHMARVNDLRMELDCLKASKEKYEEAVHDKVVEGLRETITYWRNKYVAAQEEIEKLDGSIKEWKNRERIRTEQLRATERKVGELWRLNNELKKEVDDYAKSGFKLYVKNTLAEAEGNKNEANEIITEAVRSAYTEWGKEQKEKEEETEVKGNGRTSSGRYPWGAKVNDIPCGEDAIE